LRASCKKHLSDWKDSIQPWIEYKHGIIRLTLIIPAKQEAYVGGLPSEADPDKNTRPYLKNNYSIKGYSHGASDTAPT
jgi:hypothetical protein